MDYSLTSCDSVLYLVCVRFGIHLSHDTAVHQTFRASTNQSVMARKQTRPVVTHAQFLHTCAQSLSAQEVTAVIQSHTEWTSGARPRAAVLVSHLPQLVPDSLPSLPVFTVEDMRDAQSKVISPKHYRVAFSLYVNNYWRCVLLSRAWSQDGHWFFSQGRVMPISTISKSR